MTDLSLRWIPSFVYGTSLLQLTYPVTRWIPGERTIGTAMRSASGSPGPSLRLRKNTLTMTLRFTEDEWPSVRSWLIFAQSGRSFDWMPRDLAAVTDTPELIDVLLDSPRLSDGVRPIRDNSILWLFTLSITLVRADGGIWPYEYYRAVPFDLPVVSTGGGPFYEAAFDPTGFDTEA